MKKEKRNPRSHELIREMIELYHPQSIKDIQEMLKDMFADTMEDMLKAELDTELGYSKNSQAAKTTENRRNGSYPKTVTSSMGEIELNIPRDRMGEYDPELIPKGTKDGTWQRNAAKSVRPERRLLPTSARLRKRYCRSMPKERVTGIFPM